MESTNRHGANHNASASNVRRTDAPLIRREPPTGKEFLESLRDGRVIYFDGELVKDVTTHPAFATSARSYAWMYDALHAPAKRDVLTYVTERGTRSHKFYKLPRTREDLFGARDAIAEWRGSVRARYRAGRIQGGAGRRHRR
jgi:aromatic ring hydroxylase